MSYYQDASIGKCRKVHGHRPRAHVAAPLAPCRCLMPWPSWPESTNIGTDSANPISKPFLISKEPGCPCAHCLLGVQANGILIQEQGVVARKFEFHDEDVFLKMPARGQIASAPGRRRRCQADKWARPRRVLRRGLDVPMRAIPFVGGYVRVLGIYAGQRAERRQNTSGAICRVFTALANVDLIHAVVPLEGEGDEEFSTLLEARNSLL